jgi:hypothetical protein
MSATRTAAEIGMVIGSETVIATGIVIGIAVMTAGRNVMGAGLKQVLLWFLLRTEHFRLVPIPATIGAASLKKVWVKEEGPPTTT